MRLQVLQIWRQAETFEWEIVMKTKTPLDFLEIILQCQFAYIFLGPIN